MPLFKPRASALWIALLSGAVSAPATPVDIANPVYGFLRRLEMEGRIPSGRLGSLPLPKSEVSALLQDAHSTAEAMPAWERRRLDGYREIFGLVESRDGRFHPLRYKDSAFQVEARAESFNGGYVEDSIPRAQTHGFGSISGTIDGAYRDRIHFLSNAGIGQDRSWHERFTENYDPARGLPYNTDRAGKVGEPRKVSTFDAF